MPFRRIVCFGLIALAALAPTVVRAECGGSQQCIGVSINPAVPPSHGTPLTSAPLDFVSQLGKTSAGRPILVAAVFGPAATMATLTAINLGGADAADFSIVGNTCVVGVPSLLHDGAVSASLANSCTITVAFNPTTAGPKSAQVTVSSSVITRTVPLTGSDVRASPADDPSVVGLVSAQTQTARRFSRAQISNYQTRMRSLHRGPGASAVTAGSDSGMAAGDAYPAPTGGGSSGDGDPLMLALAGPLSKFFSSGSLDLASAGGGLLPEIGDYISLWVGGNIRFGTREQTSDSNRLRFTTDGITAGMDRRLRDDLVVGLGLGFATDETDVGADGTRADSTAWSLAAYGSFQPTPETYVDALVGYSLTRHHTQRFDASTFSIARATRDGDQLFASLATGYEYRTRGVLLSPYVRFDFSYNTLDQTTETGVGTASLTYLERSFSNYELAMGLRAESTHAMRFGWVHPSAYVEYRHEFEGGDPAALVFADQPGGPIFSVAPSGVEGDALHIGLGNDFMFRDGTTLGVSYDVQLLSSLESSQGFWLWLSKEFDGKRPAPPPSASSLFKNPIQVEAGYTWDDNLNRTRDPGKLYDHIYSLTVGQGTTFPLSSNSRLAARWFLEGTKLHTYSGLDHLSGGLQGKLQYRPSGAFSAPTFGLFARGALDEYDSGLRDGYRYSVGVDVRKPLTDRIHLYAALARNARNATSAVFDGHDYSGRLRFDYSLGRAGTLNLGGEYRKGDAVSSAIGPLTANSTPDNAYPGRALFASRYDARTALVTFGYGLPLGRRDSIDISWTRVHSEPTGGQSFLASGPYGAAGGSRSYTVDQYSIFYLMRF